MSQLPLDKLVLPKETQRVVCASSGLRSLPFMPELDQAAFKVLSVLILGAIRWCREQVEITGQREPFVPAPLFSAPPPPCTCYGVCTGVS